MEKFKEQKELAEQILHLTEAKLLTRLRFLSGALTAISYKMSEEEVLLAAKKDGIYYNPTLLLKAYQNSPDTVAHAMVHCLLHLLMGHPFCHQEKDILLWNLACDMAAEYSCMELADTFLSARYAKETARQLERFQDYAGGNTAEAFYNYFLDSELPEEERTELERLFYMDSHRCWEIPEKRSGQSGRKTSGKVADSPEDETEPEAAAEGEEERPERSDKKEKQEKKWKQLARQVQTELELFQHRQGIQAGSLIQGMKPFLFETVDYTAFLRLFATENEVLQISDEEFDPIYYTYGLQKYGNIPLIEPLEYSNLHRIREFVIAIDTSGSVQGETVAEFLRQTVQVLRQTASFTDQVNIYILQCDAEIQSCIQIHELKELDDYIEHLELYGFGGTDFRPVFDYVAQLLEQKKLKKINGLLYFTDGVGVYPEAEPPYKTAFIFNRDDYGSPQVPEWAIRAVLTTENIRILHTDRKKIQDENGNGI